MRKVILCATKDRKRWHIRKGSGTETCCGQQGDYLPTDPIELPIETKYLCKICLKTVEL